MKKLFTLITLALLVSLTACKNEQKQESQEDSTAEKTNVMTPEKVMTDGASLIGKEIEIEGTVAHICEHGAKKCKLVGATPDAFIQIIAGDEIGTFGAEILGSDIVVKGVVRERKMTKQVIDQQIKEAQEKADEEGGEAKQQCCQSMQKFNDMLKWIEDNGKDYYPVYFVQGKSYKAVE